MIVGKRRIALPLQAPAYYRRLPLVEMACYKRPGKLERIDRADLPREGYGKLVIVDEAQASGSAWPVLLNAYREGPYLERAREVYENWGLSLPGVGIVVTEQAHVCEYACARPCLNRSVVIRKGGPEGG